MSAPGLTCARCERPVYPNVARATDSGYIHTRCPAVKRLELEDVEFMVATGECLNGAARRLDFKTPGALEQYLRRQGRRDLAEVLVARNPRDWNKVSDGSSIGKTILGQAYRDKEQRRNEQRKQARQVLAA